METPLTDHLKVDDFKHVYEPAEDSFFMLDALESDLPFFVQTQPLICLEIGSGSGLIITALASNLKHAFCLASDINPQACLATKRTAERNKAHMEVIQCNLADALFCQKVDLLIFNPPYVVTSDNEIEDVSKANISHAWAGGVDGRKIIDKLIKQLNVILSAQGILYLLLLRENKPAEVIDDLNKLGFVAVIYMERRIPGEYLYILKVWRKTYKLNN